MHFHLQLASLAENVPSTPPDSCSWLAGLEPDVIFCPSAIMLDKALCIVRHFSRHYCKKFSLACLFSLHYSDHSPSNRYQHGFYTKVPLSPQYTHTNDVFLLQWQVSVS